jgi:hypothetical protein
LTGGEPCDAKSPCLPFTRAALRCVPSNRTGERPSTRGIFITAAPHKPGIPGIQRIGQKGETLPQSKRAFPASEVKTKYCDFYGAVQWAMSHSKSHPSARFLGVANPKWLVAAG